MIWQQWSVIRIGSSSQLVTIFIPKLLKHSSVRLHEDGQEGKSSSQCSVNALVKKTSLAGKYLYNELNVQHTEEKKRPELYKVSPRRPLTVYFVSILSERL